MSEIRTHALARAAYDCVDRRRDAGHARQYAALVNQLPGMILQNGLAQSTGFLLAKGKPEHLALLADLNAVLRATGATDTADGARFHRAVVGSDIARTMLLTRRALDASGWLKRYVQGALRVSPAGEPASDARRD